MRIYINHLNLDILSNILDILKDYYIGFETYIQIYAIDGIYQIFECLIKKINYIDNNIKIVNNYYNNYTLIEDPSYFTTEITNKLPPEHISITLKRCFFGTNKKSNVKMVIEGLPLDKNQNNNFNIKPNDMYFEIDNNSDINDSFIKKEIIMFLSLLN
jgi:hypothetical protein